MPRLFLSYRREDTAGYAGRLSDGLSSRFGRSQIFRDIDAIPPGVNFVKNTDEAIAACDYVLVLIGDNWLSARTKTGDRRLHDRRSGLLQRARAGGQTVGSRRQQADECRIPETEWPSCFEVTMALELLEPPAATNCGRAGRDCAAGSRLRPPHRRFQRPGAVTAAPRRHPS